MAILLLLSNHVSVSQIFGLEALLGSDQLWPVLLAVTVLPAVLQCLLLPFCPESPRYLLINLNQEEQARKGEDVLKGQPGLLLT